MFRSALFSLLWFFSAGIYAQSVIDTLDIENYRIKKIPLPDKLQEISSLDYYDGYFWGNNDSGNEPEIYKIDPESGKILQTVRVENEKNKDWEEISFGGGYVFIGDFGNNRGKRKDLRIFYFPVSELDSDEKEIKVQAEKIEFHFPEQTDFDPGNHKTDFDCEAFFFYEDKLHLFTKEWTRLSTTHYTLEVKPGKQKAKKIETFKTNYAVTGAFVDDNPISNAHGFYLIGYTPDGVAFISGFSLPKEEKVKLFGEKTSKFSLPLGFAPVVGQVEGIAIKPDSPAVICFSNEDFKFKGFHAEQSIQCIHSLAQQN